ncbi:MAG: ABC transporter permease, partial [Gemmatimonadaceae bacterium]
MRRIGRHRHQLDSPLWEAGAPDEVRAELDFHLEMLTREFEARGMSRDQARAEAERRFGDPARISATSLTSARERDSAMHRSHYFIDLSQDIRFAFRQLARARTFSVIVLLTLGIGIGATTAIYSVLHAVVLRAIPAAHPERVVYVAERYLGQTSNMSIGNFVDVERQATSFAGLAAINFKSFNLAEGDAPERVLGAAVSASLFTVLGVPAILGRPIAADEDAPGRDDVVVLSDGLWTRRFGRDPAVLGRTVRLNTRPYRVIGVMPSSFNPTLTNEQLWVPAAFTPTQREQHDEHYLDVLGLLKPGVSRQQAAAEMDRLMVDLAKRFPNANIDRRGTVVPIADVVLGDLQQRLYVLFGAVLLVLLIACANVSNLLLARGASRAKELAIRTAIGAERGRLMRQLLVETGVLAVASAALGIPLAAAVVKMIVARAPTGIPRLTETTIDGSVAVFAVLLALVCSVIAGLVPALRAARRDPQQDLRDGGRGPMSTVRDGVRSILVIGEVALALTLLIGASLLIRSAVAMERSEPGFDPQGALIGRISLPDASYHEPARIVQTLERLVTALASQPGVAAAGVTSQAPMGPGGGSNGLLAEGRAPTTENIVDTRLRLISPGYLQAMRIPLKKGRAFTDRDVAGSDRVAILSEETARRLWPGEDPIGKVLQCCEGSATDPRNKTVVGVVGDVRSQGLGSPIVPEFYLPIAQAPDVAWDWIQRSMTLVLRGSGSDGSSLASAMRTAVHDIDPTVPLDRVTTMSQAMETSVAPAHFNTLLLSTLGVIGLVLAALGIYGVVSYFVSVRLHEIGVRLVLGATGRQVVRLLVVQGLRPVVIGLVVGLVGAAFSTRALASSLYGVSALD